MTKQDYQNRKKSITKTIMMIKIERWRFFSVALLTSISKKIILRTNVIEQ